MIIIHIYNIYIYRLYDYFPLEWFEYHIYIYTSLYIIIHQITDHNLYISHGPEWFISHNTHHYYTSISTLWRCIMILYHIVPYLRYHLLLSSLYQKWDDIIPLNIYYRITYYTIITYMPLIDGESQLSFAAQLPRPWSSTASSKNTPSWPPTASKQSGPPGRGVVDVTGGSLKGRFKDENMANLAKHLGISWDFHGMFIGKHGNFSEFMSFRSFCRWEHIFRMIAIDDL